jgi:hypothetical protein
MYEVIEAYPSLANPGWVAVRFKDFDSLGNRHVLGISNGSDLEFTLTASAFVIAKYRAGAFELFFNDISEQEMVERLSVAFKYLHTTNKARSANLWSSVKNHQEKVTVLEQRYT